MDFARRLFWFIVGISIGTIFVMFWLSERSDFSCSYFPDARVKNDILKKNILFQNRQLSEKDSVEIYDLLKSGDVVFSKSNTKLDSCKTYFIENNKIEISIENCDSTANVLSLKRK